MESIGKYELDSLINFHVRNLFFNQPLCEWFTPKLTANCLRALDSRMSIVTMGNYLLNKVLKLMVD
jgi:hypothetical protein